MKIATLILILLAGLNGSTQMNETSAVTLLDATQALQLKEILSQSFSESYSSTIDLQLRRLGFRSFVTKQGGHDHNLISNPTIYSQLNSVSALEQVAISQSQNNRSPSSDGHMYLALRNKFEFRSVKFIASLLDFVKQRPRPLENLKESKTSLISKHYCLLSTKGHQLLAWLQKGNDESLLKIEPNELLDGIFDQQVRFSKVDSPTYFTNRKNSLIGPHVDFTKSKGTNFLTFLIAGQKKTFELICSEEI